MMRDLTRRWFPRFISDKIAMTTSRFVYPPDLTPADEALIRWVGPYTMTSPERITALANAVRYLVKHEIPGPFVECGVWRGGSAMVMGRVLAELGVTDRDIYLYDTYAGMTPPSDVDVDLYGASAGTILASTEKRPGDRANLWCIASQADVAANLEQSGYPMDRFHLVTGTVEETIPAQAPASIALLRLDTDWYTSTKHEIEQLYPRLVSGGVLLIDDYGHWAGCRRAVDEYFATLKPAPLLHRIDYTGRMAVKR
jgi:O-methyltransferase